MVDALQKRYTSIAHIGGAATSDVSLAKRVDASEGPPIVVIKRLKLGADAEKRVADVFAAEANLALQLHHANIVRALEAGEDDDGPFLVLEYLEGVTLGRIRSRAQRRSGGVPRAIAVHIVRQVAGALAYAHELQDQAGKSLKIVHRDASPENVIVTYAGVTKVIDFGVALTALPNEARGGVIKGSVAYLAPEQAGAGVNVDARADVFALGVVLWELLAGKRLWEGLSEGDVLARLSDADTPLASVRMASPDVPEQLDAICTQALAKLRDDRYESALEMCEALDKAASELGLSATDEEVAAFVGPLFQDERDKMSAIIDGARSRAGSEPSGSVPRLSAPPPTGAGALVDVDSNPALPSVAPSGPDLPVGDRITPVLAEPVQVVEVLRIEQAPSPDRRFAYAMIGAVLMVFAVVVAVVVTYKPPKQEEEVLMTRHLSAPEATESASAVLPPVKAPKEITVEISAQPAKAEIYIDEVKAPSNPYQITVVPGKFEHDLRVEAEGFLPDSRKVAFDRERTIDIALMPKPKVKIITVTRPAPAPSPSASTTTHPDLAPPSP